MPWGRSRQQNPLTIRYHQWCDQYGDSIQIRERWSTEVRVTAINVHAPLWPYPTPGGNTQRVYTIGHNNSNPLAAPRPGLVRIVEVAGRPGSRVRAAGCGAYVAPGRAATPRSARRAPGVQAEVSDRRLRPAVPDCSVVTSSRCHNQRGGGEGRTGVTWGTTFGNLPTIHYLLLNNNRSTSGFGGKSCRRARHMTLGGQSIGGNLNNSHTTVGF